MDISQLRREYTSEGLHRRNLISDPFKQFELWFEQACKASLIDPNAMTLATVSADGAPSQRTVLLKYFDERGFVFFTNLESKKAQEMTQNEKVSLHFVWLPLNRQVIVSGEVRRASTKETLTYFLSRPRESQIAAWASAQSRKISSRQILEQKYYELKRKFADGEIPLPSFWGGYIVKAKHIEFWQGRENRLHDRFLYTLNENDQWDIDRLAP